MIRQGQSFSGHERNCVFLNTGQPRFANASFVSGIDFPDDARAAAQTDWDLDGDLDFWFSNRNAPQVRFLRNDLVSTGRYLLLRLQGVLANRDAVGAQIEVSVPNQAPLLRWVKAGSGYLTQSSKWIHIGLGEHSQVLNVRVRWPGGEVDDYGSLDTNLCYRLTQGQSATVWSPPSMPGDLPPIPVQLPQPTNEYQLYSTARLPMPRLSYRSETDDAIDILPERPTLVVLWASWCQPCLQELAELAQQIEKLESSRVRILALSVDRLDDGDADPLAARMMMDKLRLPFRWGFATRETVEKLQLVHDFLFGLERPLPVPTSFLIDDQSDLVSLYRGRVRPADVLRDVMRIKLTPHDRRDASVPFPGRWIGQPKTLHLAPLAVDLASAGYVIEASEIVQRRQNQFDRATLVDLVVRLGTHYFDLNNPDHAQLHFQMARKLSPGTLLPELSMADLWITRGAYQEAKTLLAQTFIREPRNTVVGTRLAWLLATCPDDSLRDAQRAAEIASQLLRADAKDHPETLDALAAAFAQLGQYDKAVKAANQARTFAQTKGRFRLANDISLRIRKYEANEPHIQP